MPLHSATFYSATLFIFGVFLASMGAPSFLVIWGVGLAATAFFVAFLKRRRGVLLFFSAVSIFVLLGFSYYIFYGALVKPTVQIGAVAEVRGVVDRYPEHRPQSQKLTVALAEPHRGELVVYAPPYPRFYYGDDLKIKGVVSERNGMYLAAFPEIAKESEGKGSLIKGALFSLRRKLVGVFETTLPAKHAALLAGLTLGEDAGFSKEFRESLSRSGTSHIVALSGYNIALIVSLMGIFFSYFFAKRMSFFLTLAVILFFVILTGAEASVVRAAIMGAIALLALQVGRIYSFRNAIAFAALFMVCIDPKVLVFDVGFQLSFVALLGIVYLLPAVRAVFKTTAGKGFLGWRENAFATFSAQLATTPILLKNFGILSLAALPANMLILSMVPVATVSGYFVGFLGVVSMPLAQIASWFVYPMLSYMIHVIEFFSAMDLDFHLSISPVIGAIYYAALAVFITAMHKRAEPRSKP